MKKAVLKIVALVAAGLVLLTGCSGDRDPNVAAWVNGQTISNAEVTAVSKAIAAKTSTEWGTLRSQVLNLMVVVDISNSALNTSGVSFTDKERQSALSSNAALAALLTDPVAGNFMSGYADVQLGLSNQKAATAIQSAAKAATVRVNPVYGTWDSSTIALSGSTGSLSQLVKTAS